jgi:hypothetical protein
MAAFFILITIIALVVYLVSRSATPIGAAAGATSASLLASAMGGSFPPIATFFACSTPWHYRWNIIVLASGFERLIGSLTDLRSPHWQV